MSGNSVNTRVDFTLNGQSINAPVEWTDIAIEVSFDDEGVQASITTESFRFVNIPQQKAANLIKQWVTDDLPGIFHGIPFQIQGFNNQNSLSVFDGYVNLVNDVVYLEDGSLTANIQKKDGLDELNIRLEALTWGYLEELGLVNSSFYTDVEYIVEKKYNAFEILMSNIVLFLLIKELYESIKKTSEDISGAIALLSTAGLGSVVASVVWAIAVAIIQLIYTTIIAFAVINLGNKLLETLLPRVRKHKTIQMRKAMELIAYQLGYGFVCPMSEMDDCYFLPSNMNTDDVSFTSGLITQLNGTSKGIPNITDAGYNCLDFYKIVQTMTNARIAIEAGNIQFRSKNDIYWIKSSTYQMPNVLVQEQRFNAAELKARWALLFAIDSSDEWTIDNYKGTSYEVQTDAAFTPDVKAKYISGLNEVKIPWSLGNRKNELNGLERTLRDVAQFLDSVVGSLGFNSNLAATVNNKIGMLKVSNNNTSKPKILYLQGGKLPLNHRTLFSAKVLWDKYWNEQSFVQNNFGQQKLNYQGVKIPFGLESFIELINNSYFSDYLNRQGKVTKISWNLFSDTATVDYWVKEVYTRNLVETFIEAE